MSDQAWRLLGTPCPPEGDLDPALAEAALRLRREGPDDDPATREAGGRGPGRVGLRAPGAAA